MVKKIDYTDAPKKRIVQQMVYQNAIQNSNVNKLVGLAGPNINNYLKFIKLMGFKIADIYEINPMQLLLQILDYKSTFNIKTRVQMTDVYHAEPNRDDTLYDLDFDCSILLVKKHIKKFINNAIVTLAIRPVGLKKTLSIFSRLVDKQKAIIEYDSQITEDYKLHKIIYPNKCYLCYQYRDKSNMITIIHQNFRNEKNT